MYLEYTCARDSLLVQTIGVNVWNLCSHSYCGCHSYLLRTFLSVTSLRSHESGVISKNFHGITTSFTTLVESDVQKDVWFITVA